MPTFQIHVDLSTIARNLTRDLTGLYHDDKHQVDAICEFVREIAEGVPVPDDTEFIRRMAEYFARKLEEPDGLE